MKNLSLILFLSSISISCSCLGASDAYQEEDVLISFNRAYLKEASYGSEVHFYIELKLKVVAKDRIINPRTHYRLGIRKLQLNDNFRNNLGFLSTSPAYYGDNTEVGLRPGEEIIFTLEFSNIPLESTEYLLLKVPEGVFGNVNPFELKISNPVIEPLTTKVKTKAETLSTEELLQSLRQKGELSDKLVTEKSSESKSHDIGFDLWNKEIDETRQKEIAQKATIRKVYSGMFVSLSALCSLGLIYFIWRKTDKKTIMYCKSFFLLLAQWAKQNSLHFSVLKILSALICLAWLILGIKVAITEDFMESIDVLLWSLFDITLLVLICVVGLWVIYFAFYGIIWIIFHITKNYINRILWLGILIFIAWCILSTFLDLYLRQFIPIALAIFGFMAVLIYTSRKINPANKQKE